MIQKCSDLAPQGINNKKNGAEITNQAKFHTAKTNRNDPPTAKKPTLTLRKQGLPDFGANSPHRMIQQRTQASISAPNMSPKTQAMRTADTRPMMEMITATIAPGTPKILATGSSINL
mmetsp:Transcript_34589/g.53734  ORF Transcript_34589/g.53734 Transcript_34589/m.53734 type:complete len:118 (+) Transcript_34589:1-354(+)